MVAASQREYKELEMAVEKADVSGFSRRKAQSRERGMLRGLGIAYVIERAAWGGVPP